MQGFSCAWARPASPKAAITEHTNQDKHPPANLFIASPFANFSTSKSKAERSHVLRIPVYRQKRFFPSNFRTLREGAAPAGPHRVRWTGDDDAGRGVGSGVYFAVFETQGFRHARRLVLLK